MFTRTAGNHNEELGYNNFNPARRIGLRMADASKVFREIQVNLIHNTVIPVFLKKSSFLPPCMISYFVTFGLFCDYYVFIMIIEHVALYV